MPLLVKDGDKTFKSPDGKLFTTNDGYSFTSKTTGTNAGSDGKIFPAKDRNDAQKQADKFYKKKNCSINQDKNVLDTWFSSALWPFASLGWPKKTYNFKRFYKTIKD